MNQSIRSLEYSRFLSSATKNPSVAPARQHSPTKDQTAGRSINRRSTFSPERRCFSMISSRSAWST